eukprot:c23041_g1_i1 orf=389-1159(-)
MQAQKQIVRRNEYDASSWQQGKVWCDWKAHVQSLRLALQSKSPDSHIRQLISECMAFYKATYSIPPTTDSLLATISGRNSSLLEASFMWLGGWRPSSAITLAYSKMGVSVGKPDELGVSITSSCVLSRTQLAAMEVLCEQTRQAETEISSSLACLQMLVADQNMTEALGIGSSPSSPRRVGQAQRLMDNKLVSLRTLYMQANGLRLQTLQELHSLLTPTQAAHCAVAAFEVAYAVRNLGATPPYKMPSCECESMKV